MLSYRGKILTGLLGTVLPLAVAGIICACNPGPTPAPIPAPPTYVSAFSTNIDCKDAIKHPT